MTPHKAIEVLKELKPGDAWRIQLDISFREEMGGCEDWKITRVSHAPPVRQYWEGSTLDEAMEKVLESLKV